MDGDTFIFCLFIVQFGNVWMTTAYAGCLNEVFSADFPLALRCLKYDSPFLRSWILKGRPDGGSLPNIEIES